jgi:O-antigen ligase
MRGQALIVKAGWKEKVLLGVDRAAPWLFMMLAFFLAISNAAVEIASTAIIACLVLKGVCLRPSWRDFKIFFGDGKNLTVLVFYISLGISAVMSPLIGKSLDQWIFKWGEGVLLFYAAQVFIKRSDVLKLIAVLLASTFILTLDGIYQRVMGVDFLRGFGLLHVLGFTQIRATFNHYNNLATFLVTVFFLAVGLWVEGKSSWMRKALGVLLALILVNLFLTYSRGGWIAFLITCLLLMLFAGRRAVRVTVGCVIIAFLTSIVAVESMRERLIYIFGVDGDQGRWRMWVASVLMFLDSPLYGLGLGTFMNHLDIYLSQYVHHRSGFMVLGAQYAHNGYLQILAEAGGLGLASFLAMLVTVLGSGLRELGKKFDPLLFGMLGGAAGYCMHAFFDNGLYSLRLAMLFWFLLGLIGVLGRPALNPSDGNEAG